MEQSKRTAEIVRKQLQHAVQERDAWRGKSQHHVELGTKLVEALRKELQAIEKNEGK